MSGHAGAIVGTVVGAFVGYPQLGYVVGSLVDGVFGPKPDGPSAGDLSAPGLSLGSLVPRVYGRVRRVASPIWTSDYRAIEHSSGGKGGPSGPSSFTYEADALFILADGANVIAATRTWVNKMLVWTALADSDAASLLNSSVTDYWASFELFTGDITQLPPDTYEDAVGTANAPAYRGMCTILFRSLQCGSAKTLPQIDVEIITKGTQGATDYNMRVRADFNAGDSTDSSYSAITPTFTGSVYSYASGAITIGSVNVNTGVAWNDAALVADAAKGWTFGALGTLNSGVADGAYIAIWTSGSHIQMAFEPVAQFPFSQWQLRLRSDSLGAPTLVGPLFNFGEFITIAVVRPVGASVTARVYINGLQVYTYTDSYAGTGELAGIVEVRKVAATTASQHTTNYTFLSWGELYTADYTPPADAPPADFPLGTWAPLPEMLSDIITAELSYNPSIATTDFDVTDVADIAVRGVDSIGPPANSLADPCDWFYVDVVPGPTIRFKKRGVVSVGSVANADTGMASGQPAQLFAGLKVGNADELPAVYGVSYPEINRNHEAGFQRGDRLNTESPDITRIQTRVVSTPEEAKGRALTATLMARVRKKTAQSEIGNKYARMEVADTWTWADYQGGTYTLRTSKLNYADGVLKPQLELDDASLLTLIGITDANDEPNVTVAAAGVGEWLELDLPRLRDEDTDAGRYTAVKISDDSRAYFFESANNVTYTEVGSYPVDAVFGTVTAVTGTLTADGLFNEYATLTVDVGDGTLSSSTRAALLADRNTNLFSAGINGRQLLGQYRDATLVSAGVYTLSGLLMGARGTEQYVDDVVAGDNFVLLNASGGIHRQPRSVAQLGVPFYSKAVPQRRSQASITGVSFTNQGVSLTPLSPVHLTVTRDVGTGDITIAWLRRTRADTRFGGDFGDATPLGEESERYRVRLYTSNTYVTVLRDLGTLTTASAAYTAAQISADGKVLADPLYVGITQVSAVIGEGYALQEAA